jgi:predicted RNA-binding Zn-ribbon protein involved in translation (DUF1610 family)
VIGRVTPDGIVTHFSAFSGSNSAGITTGPDGRLWFTAPVGNRIGRFTPPPVVPFTRIAVYRPTTGEWFVSVPSGLQLTPWGCPACGDIPVPEDYDADGKSDIAVYRPATAEWFIRRSSDGSLLRVAWGCQACGDTPVPGDYDADAEADIGVYRRSTSEWFIRRSSDGGLTQTPWGCPTCGDVPVPHRY